MQLAREVDLIRSEPTQYLTEACVIAFGAFLSGYQMTDAGSKRVLDKLAATFEGPQGADACTRAYLSSSNSRGALERVLDSLAEALRSAPESESTRGLAADLGFVELVRAAIVGGRPGMVFAEPTVLWCANYWMGFIAGLGSVDPEAAARERSKLDRFEQWLRRRYECFGAPWYAMIRIYGGADLHGLRLLISSWDEFLLEEHASA